MVSLQLWQLVNPKLLTIRYRYSYDLLLDIAAVSLRKKIRKSMLLSVITGTSQPLSSPGCELELVAEVSVAILTAEHDTCHHSALSLTPVKSSSQAPYMHMCHTTVTTASVPYSITASCCLSGNIRKLLPVLCCL